MRFFLYLQFLCLFVEYRLNVPNCYHSLALGVGGGASNSLDFAFPPELAGALRRLFHLRRGPLLSTGPIQSTDDRAEIRSMFLRLPLQDSLCMMAPTVWSSGSVADTASRELVPAETLSLWDNVSMLAEVRELRKWFTAVTNFSTSLFSA